MKCPRFQRKPRSNGSENVFSAVWILHLAGSNCFHVVSQNWMNLYRQYLFFFFIYPVTSCSFSFFCMDPQIKIILGDKSVYGVLLCNIHWHQQQFRWHYLLRRQYSKHDDFKWKLSAWITFVLMKITPQTCSYQIIYFLWHSDFKMVIKTW